jgi:hypothetical protein
MEKITMLIKVEDFYHERDLYGYMPRGVFDALEAAWHAGQSVAEVPAALYNEFKNDTPAELWPETSTSTTPKQ